MAAETRAQDQALVALWEGIPRAHPLFTNLLLPASGAEPHLCPCCLGGPRDIMTLEQYELWVARDARGHAPESQPHQGPELEGEQADEGGGGGGGVLEALNVRPVPVGPPMAARRPPYRQVFLGCSENHVRPPAHAVHFAPRCVYIIFHFAFVLEWICLLIMCCWLAAAAVVL